MYLKYYKISIFLFLSVSIYFKSSGQSPLETKVAVVNGKPSFVINGKAFNPMIYSLTDVPGGRWSWEELPRYNLQSFCKAGFELFQVDLFLDHVWKEDGSIDLTISQKQLQGVLEVCPQAKIFIRFHVNPPKWWQKKFPEENTVYADTKAKPDYDWGVQRIIEDDEENPERFSLASEKWKNEASSKLREYLEKLSKLPEANSIAGIQVASGVYGEWHYWGFIENEPDISLPMLNFFKNWLKNKYKTDVALQNSWAEKTVTFSSVSLPALSERKTSSAGIFRDPQKERKVIDYYEAQHTCVADDIIHFCKVVKDNWPRPIITGAFYGYYYAVFGREAAGGHLELQRVLNSPYVDYLSGPGTYYPDAVQPGDAYRSRSLLTTIRLHGKVWLDEMDQQPPLVPLKDSLFNTSVQKSIGMVRRNVMSTFVHGAGLWFYDFGPSGFNGGKRLNDHGSWGWWDEPSLMKDITHLKQLLDKQFEKPFARQADVLLVHDTKSFYYTGSDRNSSFMGHWANNWIPPAIYKSGVVHDLVHIDDLGLLNLDNYKAIVFINTWTMNESQKQFIQSKLAKNGRNLIFMYAPAFSNEVKLDEKFVEELTGFSLRMINDDHPKSITLDKDLLVEGKITVWNRAIKPMFIIDDKNATPLGFLDSSKDVGVARKTEKTHTAWYFSLPPDNVGLWRSVFRQCGAHIYEDSGDVIYGGNGMLVIHTNQGGPRKINLRNGTVKQVDMKPYSTLIIDAETGNDLME
jgi:hypothetical protein